MRGKEKKKGRGKEEKKEEKEKKMGIKSQKRSPCASFSFAQSSSFRSIRNTLFRVKHTISTFVFMGDIFVEQIMLLSASAFY